MGFKTNKDLEFENMTNEIITKGKPLGNNLVVYDEEQAIHTADNSHTLIFHGVFQVAVKRIPTNSPQLQEGKREAGLLKLCNHPNILKYCGDKEKGAFFYIATELCKETLEKFLAPPHQIEYKIKREILLQVTRGLDYLHRGRIVHRDIKPANIFIAEDNGLTVLPRVVLADFGSSIHLEEKHEDFLNDNPDKNNPSWGTIGWMAPELYKKERCSSKMDVFSLGLVFAYTLFKERNHNFVRNNDVRQENIADGKLMTLFKDRHLDKQDPVCKNLTFGLIGNMLHNEPEHRWKIDRVLDKIQLCYRDTETLCSCTERNQSCCSI